MIENELATQVIREYSMEPNINFGELTDIANVAAVVEDENNLPGDISRVDQSADEVAVKETEEGTRYYEVQVGLGTQCYKVEYIQPVLDILDKEFSEAFLFREAVDTYSVARAPLPGDGDWNVVVAEYKPPRP